MVATVSGGSTSGPAPGANAHQLMGDVLPEADLIKNIMEEMVAGIVTMSKLTLVLESAAAVSEGQEGTTAVPEDVGRHTVSFREFVEDFQHSEATEGILQRLEAILKLELSAAAFRTLHGQTADSCYDADAEADEVRVRLGHQVGRKPPGSRLGSRRSSLTRHKRVHKAYKGPSSCTSPTGSSRTAPTSSLAVSASAPAQHRNFRKETRNLLLAFQNDPDLFSAFSEHLTKCVKEAKDR